MAAVSSWDFHPIKLLPRLWFGTNLKVFPGKCCTASLVSSSLSVNRKKKILFCVIGSYLNQKELFYQKF